MKSCWVATILTGLGLLLAGSLGACSGDQTSPDVPVVNDGDDGNNGDGPKLCTTDAECPDGQSCQDGVCTAAGACNCNYDCDKAAGQVCNQATGQCESGAPPVNCQSDCDCFSGESCIGNQCRPSGGDETPCSTDADCDSGETCQNGHCLPTNCSSREDCAGATCLICVQGECVAPPPVCQGTSDCCVGYYCNFGTCVPESTDECLSDSDCTDDPEFPRCVDGKCVQECVNDIDCPLADQVCVDNHCKTPGCQPETCPTGQWCDTGDGQCKPGCDANEDCTPPDSCNYVTHECGEVDCCGGCPTDKYCDTLTCQCVDMCGATHPCPSGYTCEADGRCWCTEGACPAGSHCNTSTGQCEQDTVQCTTSADCPTGWYCDTSTNTCTASSGGGHDGDFCFFDAQCDAAANFYCDNCIYCIIFDSSYNPTFTCREQCSVLVPNCPNNYDCYFVILKFMGLCLPPP